MNTPQFVSDFREAAPYIHDLRGKTLVIGISGSLMEAEPLGRLAADLNLLAGLGVRLVLVHGACRETDRIAAEQGLQVARFQGRRITTEALLQCVKQACGLIRCDIEAALYSVSQTLQRYKPLTTASGNFIAARPLGIIGGTDMGYTGVVRKVDAEALNQRLDHGAVVLISPLGYSLSGKVFHLSMTETAEAVATALQAEKLIYLTEAEGITGSNGLISNLSADEARHLMAQQPDTAQSRLLHHAVQAVEHGVARVQILSGRADGHLLRELFTRHGAGTSIAQNAFVNIRAAQIGDVPHIAALIRPLEAQGILLHRSQAYLENHIGSFFVLEHDRHLYGCVALKTFGHAASGELACLAVSPQARAGGYGEMLLDHLLQQARRLKMQRVFALTTHTGEWFLERGFRAAAPTELPPERYQDYTANGRNSQVLVYELENGVLV